MHRKPAFALAAVRRLEGAFYRGGWAARLVSALGLTRRLTTKHIEVQTPSARFDGPPLRMAYASDFHGGPTTDPEVVSAACAALRAARPDVVLLGGDFVNFGAGEIDGMIPELEAVAAEARSFAVLGNHDWLADPRYITERLESAGIEVLTNRNVRLSPPFDQVWMCGLDDHWCGSPDARAAFDGAEGVRVVLMHAPSGLLDIGDHRFDLALCGHTHGGQIALPGGRPVILPNGALSRRFHRGRYDLSDGRTLIVSVGVGCAVLPLRLHADPEVVVCTLRGPDAVGAPISQGDLQVESPVTPGRG